MWGHACPIYVIVYGRTERLSLGLQLSSRTGWLWLLGAVFLCTEGITFHSMTKRITYSTPHALFNNSATGRLHYNRWPFHKHVNIDAVVQTMPWKVGSRNWKYWSKVHVPSDRTECSHTALRWHVKCDMIVWTQKAQGQPAAPCDGVAFLWWLHRHERLHFNLSHRGSHSAKETSKPAIDLQPDACLHLPPQLHVRVPAPIRLLWKQVLTRVSAPEHTHWCRVLLNSCPRPLCACRAWACEKVLTGGVINGHQELKVKDKTTHNLNLKNRFNYLQYIFMFKQKSAVSKTLSLLVSQHFHQ